MTAAKKTGHPDTCLQVPQVLARWECNEEASPVFSEYLGCPSSEWWMAGEELSTAEREDPRREFHVVAVSLRCCVGLHLACWRLLREPALS